MTTLTQPRLSSLIDRLFVEADAAADARRPAAAHDRADYRQYYGHLKDQPLPVSRATGKLLYILARSVRAKNIIEFGTSFGISTLHLAAALRDNGGGRLIGTEFEPSKIKRARENLAAGGLSDLVEIREGDALETLEGDLPMRSILYYSMVPKCFTSPFSSWLRRVCAVALSSSLTTRTPVPNMLRVSGPQPTAICRSPSPMT